jgi:hypothetical protein
VVSAYSFAFTPSRDKSLWYVVTPARSVTPIVAVADFVPSATLVAVTVIAPAAPGATYVAVVVLCALKLPALADQVTPALPTSLVTDAVNGSDCPRVSPPRFGVRLTLTVPPLAAVTVIVAEAFFVVSRTEVAVSVTVAGVGTAAGAVYVMPTPDALDAFERVPQVGPLHPVPLRVQFTPLFCESFETIAVNVCVLPVCTVAEVGATATETPAEIVIVAGADFVVSATDVAVIVTVAGVGMLAGALYVMAVPDALVAAERAPHVAPEHPVPESFQLTPLF